MVFFWVRWRRHVLCSERIRRHTVGASDWFCLKRTTVYSASPRTRLQRILAGACAWRSTGTRRGALARFAGRLAGKRVLGDAVDRPECFSGRVHTDLRALVLRGQRRRAIRDPAQRPLALGGARHSTGIGTWSARSTVSGVAGVLECGLPRNSRPLNSAAAGAHTTATRAAEFA